MWTYSTSLYPPANNDFWQRYARVNSADHHGAVRILAFENWLWHLDLYHWRGNLVKKETTHV